MKLMLLKARGFSKTGIPRCLHCGKVLQKNCIGDRGYDYRGEFCSLSCGHSWAVTVAKMVLDEGVVVAPPGRLTLKQERAIENALEGEHLSDVTELEARMRDILDEDLLQEALDEFVHDAFSTFASDVNNEGIAGQLEALVANGYQPWFILQEICGIPKEK